MYDLQHIEPMSGLTAALNSSCHCQLRSHRTPLFWRPCSLVPFFKELPVVLNKVKPYLSQVTGNADGVEAELQKLREWQETLGSLNHVSNKYKV
jgi:hypothetical protein